MDIFERIKKFDLPLGEYAVFGSSLLEVFGIRKAADLDIIVTPALFEKLKKNGWEEIQANGFNMLRKGETDVTTIQEKPTDGSYCPDRTKLIKEAVIIQGLPFVKIEEVVACKTDYNREKDIVDIAAIQKYIESKGNKNIYP